MPVPIFVDEIFCRNFSYCPKPLWAPGRHPEKISGGSRIPGIAEPVNSSAFEHDESVFHDMHLDHAERGAGLVDHGIDGKIKAHLVWQEVPDLQVWIVVERLRVNLIFVRNNQVR